MPKKLEKPERLKRLKKITNHAESMNKTSAFMFFSED